MPSSKSITNNWLLVSALTATCLGAETRFCHLHLLATDPDATLAFYEKRFDGVRSILRAERVAVAPREDGYSAFWHFGFGAPDFRAEYQRQLDLGSRMSHEAEQLLPNLYYAYIAAPHGVEVEINTARAPGFLHIHLYSADPIAAAEWYVKELGLKPARPLARKPVTIGKYHLPQGTAALDLGLNGPQLLIFPKIDDNLKNVQPMKGRAVDRLVFTVDAAQAAPRLLDAPDGVRIELIPRP